MLIRGTPDALKPPKNPLGVSGLGEIDPYAQRILDQSYKTLDPLTLYNSLRFRMDEGTWADSRLNYGALTPQDFGQWAVSAGLLDQKDVDMALNRMIADTACDLRQFTREEALARVQEMFPGSINAVTLATDFLNEGETCLDTILDAARAVAQIEYQNKLEVAQSMVTALENESTVYGTTPELVENYSKHIQEYERAIDENTTALKNLPPPVTPPAPPPTPAPALASQLPPGLDKLDIFGAAAVYNQLLQEGNSDADIRAAVDFVYGVQADGDWAMLQRAADDLRRPITALPIDFEKTPVTFDDGWTPGLTMDRVTWRNRVTGQTRVGSSSDTPPSSDWEIVRTTTPLFPEDRPVFESPTTQPPTTQPPAAGGGVAPLLLAVAAAAILGG